MPDHASLNEIIGLVRKYSQRELLVLIATQAASLDKLPGRHLKFQRNRKLGSYNYVQVSYMATHGLAALTRIVLAHGNKWSRRIPIVEDLVLLENRVQNLPSFFGSAQTGTVTIEELFFQLSHQQMRFQTKREFNSLSRALVLYRDVPAVLNSEGVTCPFDLEEEFSRIVGMPMGRFIWSGLGIFGASLLGKPIGTKHLESTVSRLAKAWEGPEDDRPDMDSVRQFLEYVSLDIDGFVQQIGDLRKQDERIINVEFQPLLKFPVVVTGKEEYVVPIPELLLDRITDGLFHDFANGLEEGGTGNPFREYFGKLFERYVGLQIAEIFDAADLYPERNYGTQGRATPDWFINDAISPVAIECRSSTFSLSTTVYSNLERIIKDLQRIGSETVSKLQPKVEDIIGSKTHIETRAQEAPLNVLCTFESMAPIGLYGRLLQNAIEERSEDSPPRFHLVPIDYLEDMCALEDRQIFFSALKLLEVDESWGNRNEEGIEARWLKAMPEGRRKNRILRRTGEKFLSALESLS